MVLTADKRDERFAEYLRTLRKWEITDVRSERLSRVSDLRKKLLVLLEQIIEERAEALAAGIVERYTGEKQERPMRPAFGTPEPVARADEWRHRRLGTR